MLIVDLPDAVLIHMLEHLEAMVDLNSVDLACMRFHDIAEGGLSLVESTARLRVQRLPTWRRNDIGQWPWRRQLYYGLCLDQPPWPQTLIMLGPETYRHDEPFAALEQACEAFFDDESTVHIAHGSRAPRTLVNAMTDQECLHFDVVGAVHPFFMVRVRLDRLPGRKDEGNPILERIADDMFGDEGEFADEGDELCSSIDWKSDEYNACLRHGTATTEFLPQLRLVTITTEASQPSANSGTSPAGTFQPEAVDIRPITRFEVWSGTTLHVGSQLVAEAVLEWFYQTRVTSESVGGPVITRFSVANGWRTPRMEWTLLERIECFIADSFAYFQYNQLTILEHRWVSTRVLKRLGFLNQMANVTGEYGRASKTLHGDGDDEYCDTDDGDSLADSDSEHACTTVRGGRGRSWEMYEIYQCEDELDADALLPRAPSRPSDAQS